MRNNRINSRVTRWMGGTLLLASLLAFVGAQPATGYTFESGAILLELRETARVQVIHNAADPAAAAVDIYLNDALALDDFGFREATPFIDLPSNTEITIGVAPGNSSGPQDIIATFPVILETDGTYVVVANGVLDPNAFAPNPDGRSTAFTLFVKPMAREAAVDPMMVDFFALHGSTDAPTVDVVARGVATLVDNAAYGDITDYISVPAGAYTVDITPGSDNSVAVASYQVDLSGLAGGSAVVFASGFLSPGDNQNGEAFGLLAALADGTVVAFPAIATSRVQVIHNAADPAAAVVDVYINDGLAIDDFVFRAATPFIDLPGNTNLAIGVAPGNSSGPEDVIATFPVNLLAGETFVVVANGVLDPNAFAPNPDGRSTAFTLFVKPMARETSVDPSQVEVSVVHGVTDAPAVDVRTLTKGQPIIANDAAYGDITGYAGLRPRQTVIRVTTADGAATVGQFRADLRGLGGLGITVLASGFANPGQNQGGEPLTLIAVLPDGAVVDLVLLRLALKMDEETEVEAISAGIDGRTLLMQNLPNPFRTGTVISFRLESEQDVDLKVLDVTGRVVRSLADGRMPAGMHQIQLDSNGMAAGVYYYRLTTPTSTQTKKMIVTR